MIRIQEHLNRIDADEFLDSLAEELWNELNPKVKGKNRYKAVSLIEKCKKFSIESTKASYIEEYANKDLATASRHKFFFDFLNANNSEELKKLVVSKPNDLFDQKTAFLEIITVNDLYTGTPGNFNQTKFGKLLSERVFDYKKFRGSDFCKDLFSKLGFESTTCPYCNDNNVKITKIRSNSSIVTKRIAYLDLDHFFPKSLNPFFALSFFNLIPTCHDCNARDKRDKDFKIESHIHPYYESFDDFYKFKISLVSLLGNSIDSIDIENNNLKPLDNTLEDFNLIARYDMNFKEANELIDKFWKNKNHIGGEFESTFKELVLMNIPKERKEILKYQRGKMKRDILKQVDINNFLKLI